MRERTTGGLSPAILVHAEGKASPDLLLSAAACLINAVAILAPQASACTESVPAGSSSRELHPSMCNLQPLPVGLDAAPQHSPRASSSRTVFRCGSTVEGNLEAVVLKAAYEGIPC